MTDSPLQISRVPSLSPADMGKHHTGWVYPGQRLGTYRVLSRTGPNAAPRTHMGSPVWTASNHFTTTSPGREQGGREQAEHLDQGPARAV